MKKNALKISILVLILVGIAGFFALGGTEYVSLESVKEHRAAFEKYYAQHPVTVILIFMGGYIVATALSLPGAAVLTLLGGALFGVVVGTVIVSLASTIGATCAFLAARFVLGNAIQKRYGEKLRKMNEGVEREGSLYLFALRLVPIFPFFLINIAMGLTPIRLWKYVLASWLGMIPGTIAYVFAGTQLAQVESLADVLSFNVVIAFVILGVLPLALKKAMNFWRTKHGKKAL